ncbi:hypothetical protein KBC89_01250 [Candidatus Woesebacteria bacterium]|nr:hypothetical protein [Candidatus Woesebacteria bacterium]
MPIETGPLETIEKFVNRVPPIDPNNPSIKVESRKESLMVLLHWQQRSTDYRSEIIISLNDSTNADEQLISEWKKRPRVVLTSFEVGKNKRTEGRNPFDAIRIVLTIMAVLTELSMRFGSLTHIVRANENSRSIFELLVNLGIYYPSDDTGSRIDIPRKWEGTNYTIFACKYPVARLPDLSTYALEAYVNALSRGYSEHAVKLSDPITQVISDIFIGDSLE